MNNLLIVTNKLFKKNIFINNFKNKYEVKLKPKNRVFTICTRLRKKNSETTKEKYV